MQKTRRKMMQKTRRKSCRDKENERMTIGEEKNVETV